jgi:cytochrome P450 family 4
LKALKVMHDFSDRIIEKRREDLMKQAHEEYFDDDTSEKRKKALIDILLCSTIDGQPLSNADIREEVDTFIFAGHDTTTSGITFILYSLAKHPEIQEKVYEEIVEVLGGDDDLTAKKLNKLHYLELVIKETLRLFPPVANYGRQLNEEFTAGDYTFPKGCNMIISPFLLGRSPDYFKDPETFNPHRFDTETTYEKMNPFSYVPFSAGSIHLRF